MPRCATMALAARCSMLLIAAFARRCRRFIIRERQFFISPISPRLYARRAFQVGFI